MAHFPRYIWRGGKRLYFYDQYSSGDAAWKIAKYYQKKLKNNYFILKTEGNWTTRLIYGLYMNKVYSVR